MNEVPIPPHPKHSLLLYHSEILVETDSRCLHSQKPVPTHGMFFQGLGVCHCPLLSWPRLWLFCAANFCDPTKAQQASGRVIALTLQSLVWNLGPQLWLVKGLFTVMLGEEMIIWHLKFLSGPSSELLDLTCVSGLQEGCDVRAVITPVRVSLLGATHQHSPAWIHSLIFWIIFIFTFRSFGRILGHGYRINWLHLEESFWGKSLLSFLNQCSYVHFL